MPTALVRNGRVVTASESYEADLYVDGGRDRPRRPGPEPARGHGDRRLRVPRPARRDRRAHAPRHAGRGAHLGRRLRDRHPGRRLRRHDDGHRLRDAGARPVAPRRPRHVDAKGRGQGGPSTTASTWPCASVGETTLAEMARLTRDEGVTSFKLYLAYPGVLQVDDAAFFRALLGARECGALPLVHAENGGVIDVLVRRALARGETSPLHHALTRPPETEAEATARAIAMAEMAGAPLYVVHLSCAAALAHVEAARDRGPGRLRRDLPAVPVPLDRRLRPPRLRGGAVRDVAAAAGGGRPGGALARPRGRRPAGGGDRPLPVHAGRQGARQGRLLEDPERRARHRDADDAAVGRRGARGEDRRAAVRRADVGGSGQDLRPVAPQGHDRGGLRRRPRDLGPGARDAALGRDAPHASGLQPLRGAGRPRRPRRRDVARRGDRGPRGVEGPRRGAGSS